MVMHKLKDWTNLFHAKAWPRDRLTVSPPLLGILTDDLLGFFVYYLMTVIIQA